MPVNQVASPCSTRAAVPQLYLYSADALTRQPVADACKLCSQPFHMRQYRSYIYILADALTTQPLLMHVKLS